VKVEILHIAGCPNAVPAREIVEQALTQLGVEADVQTVLVSGEEAPGSRGFAGSPTVLINGRDVEPTQATGVACRIYPGGKGVPALEAILRAVERARAVEKA